MERKMHAGEARNSRDQRAHGGKFLAGIVETAKLAEKQHKKCTPESGGKVEASVQKETKPPPAEGRWAKRSDSREKMHAGDGRKGVGRRAKGDKISVD